MKHFTPEREFGFAADHFALIGEVSRQTEVKPEPKPDTETLPLFGGSNESKANDN